MKKLLYNIHQYIERIENSNVPFVYWVVSLFGVILLRNFLEGIIEHQSLYLSPRIWESFLRYFLHYPAFYLVNIFTLVIILYIFTQERIDKVLKVVISFSWAILICPLVDALLLKGNTYPLGYFESLNQVFRAFLYLFYFPVKFPTVSYGIRIEVMFIIILVFCYVFIKKGVFSSLRAGVTAYFSFILLGGGPVIFLSLGSLPWGQEVINRNLLAGVGVKGSVFLSADSFFFTLYYILTVAVASVCYFIYDKRKFIALVKNIRPFRALHYVLLSFAGAGYGWIVLHTRFMGNHLNIFIWPLLSAAVFFVWQSSVVFNDIADENADRTINVDRPLIRGVFGKEEYMKVGVIFLILGLSAALGISYFCFLMMLLFWINYFIYSCYPLRFKRVFPVNMALITLNGFIVFLGGLSVFTGANCLYYLRPEIGALLIIPYFLGVNVITLKDFDSDKESGVKTLPVLLGLERAKFVIAFLSLLAFISAGIILKTGVLLVIGFLMGVVGFYLVVKRVWQEYLFFINYLIYLVIVMVTYGIKIR